MTTITSMSVPSFAPKITAQSLTDSTEVRPKNKQDNRAGLFTKHYNDHQDLVLEYVLYKFDVMKTTADND